MKYFQSSRYPLELVLSENIEKQYHTHNHVNHWVLTMVISGNILVQIHETQLETHEVISGKGLCINDGVSILYEAGTISIMPAGIKHEVNAGKEGLYLFAKFMPPLC